MLDILDRVFSTVGLDGKKTAIGAALILVHDSNLIPLLFIPLGVEADIANSVNDAVGKVGRALSSAGLLHKGVKLKNR